MPLFRFNPSELAQKKVVVVGLGRTGVSVVKYLLSRGAQVTVSDVKSRMELAEFVKQLTDLEVEYDLGRHNPKLLTQSDIVVLSPGVPSTLEGIHEAKQAGIPVINDFDLAAPFLKAPIIAVTGTNGKTTTTTLIGEMLKADGKNVFVGGNIGNPVLNMVLEGQSPDFIVLEVSSFQLEHTFEFKPNVAVFTNLEPDHLDRYPNGVESYYAAKRRLLQKADKDTVLITNFDNDAAARLADDFVGTSLFFTRRNPMNIHASFAEKFKGAYYVRPRMHFKLPNSQHTFEMLTCKLPGDHNKENLMAAALAAQSVGCSESAIQAVVSTFKGVPHRLEFVRKKDGVSFYNDSKATNVASVLRSLSSFQSSIILIAGGRDKDQDFGPLVELVKKRVKNLILVGEAKEKINRVIGDFTETFLVGTFEEAVLLSYQKSRTGDVVLLSPSCASYDMFKSYEERGDYFKKLVSQL